MALDVKSAHLTAIVIQCLLYGVSVPLFVATIWALRGLKYAGRLWYPVTCALFALSTMHVVVDARHIFIGFIERFDVADEYFAAIVRETTKNAIYLVETMTADAILIYRCYMVYQRWEAIALPALCWLTTAIDGPLAVFAMDQHSRGIQSTFAMQSRNWVVSFYATAFCTNIISTSILAWKLWSYHCKSCRINASLPSGQSALGPIFLTVVECGAIYSTALIVMVVVFATATDAQYVVYCHDCQVIALTFYMVIVRAAMSRVGKELRSSTAHTRSLSAMSFSRGPPTTSMAGGGGYEVHINRLSRSGRGMSHDYASDFPEDKDSMPDMTFAENDEVLRRAMMRQPQLQV
ncbi:hypothetical protein BD626DRAFT_406886 [Schizophyllum amplum]|uniref:Uncharacterized protein n=1 Tax=Schizophyllum amplum TaxID=97359 RepID=A0A550C7H6_9AGAR|nr:hypothetical protein BD626DRAFT_406886 [Auriculariopsis ampla]